jgi:hypothetical protein
MRWKCLTALALILGGTVSSVVGCAGRDSSGAEKPRPATVPESPLGETVLVTEPRRGENGTTRRESAPAVHERIPPAPAVDLATLPPGPVTCSDCGPAPGYPSWQCPDGHQGGRGPCVRLSDGMCGWINLVCAGQGSCSASECGASPSPIEWRCPDEEHRGYFACVRGDDGRCGWTHSPCPQGRPRPRPAPAAQAQPPPRFACNPLPNSRELRTWEVQSICQPGGGPMPPERRVVLSFGDGTHVIEDQRGCFRARYRQCNSK